MDAVAVNDVGNDPGAAKPGRSDPLAPWSKRVRWVGGMIQAAFAVFWLIRGSVVLGGGVAGVMIAVSGVAGVAMFAYAIKVARGTAPRPASPEGKRIERAVTIATVIEFAAAIVLPVIVSATGHPDWVLPSIAITIGPLLLWLDHPVSVPRYRPVGWALTIGPVIIVIVMSGTPLVATTGLGAGVLLLGTSLAGFHDLAKVRRAAQNAKPDDVILPTRTGVPA